MIEAGARQWAMMRSRSKAPVEEKQRGLVRFGGKEDLLTEKERKGFSLF